MIRLSDSQKAQLADAIQNFKANKSVAFAALSNVVAKILQEVFIDGIVTNSGLKLVPELHDAVKTCAKFEHSYLEEWINMTSRLKMRLPHDPVSSFTELKNAFQNAKKHNFMIDSSYELYRTLTRVANILSIVPEENTANLMLDRIQKSATFNTSGMPLPNRAKLLEYCVECARENKNPLDGLQLCTKNFLCSVVARETGMNVSEWMQKVIVPFSQGTPKHLEYMLSDKEAVRNALMSIKEPSITNIKLAANTANFEGISIQTAFQAIPAISNEQIDLEIAIEKPAAYKACVTDDSTYLHKLCALRQSMFDIQFNKISKALASFDLRFFIGDTFSLTNPPAATKHFVFEKIKRQLSDEECIKILERTQNNDILQKKINQPIIQRLQINVIQTQSLESIVAATKALTSDGTYPDTTTDEYKKLESAISDELLAHPNVYQKAGIKSAKDFINFVGCIKLPKIPEGARKPIKKSLCLARLAIIAPNKTLDKPLREENVLLYRQINKHIKQHAQTYDMQDVCNVNDFVSKIAKIKFPESKHFHKNKKNTCHSLTSRILAHVDKDGALPLPLSTLDHSLYSAISRAIARDPSYAQIGVRTVADFISKVAKISKIKKAKQDHSAYNQKVFEEQQQKLIAQLTQFAQNNGGSCKSLSKRGKVLYNRLKHHLLQYKERYAPIGVMSKTDFITKIAGLDAQLTTKPNFDESMQQMKQAVQALAVDGVLPCAISGLNKVLNNRILYQISANKEMYAKLGVANAQDFATKIAGVSIKTNEKKPPKPKKPKTTEESLVQELLAASENGRISFNANTHPQNQVIYSKVYNYIKRNKTKYQQASILTVKDFVTKIAGLTVGKSNKVKHQEFERQKKNLITRIQSEATNEVLSTPLSMRNKSLYASLRYFVYHNSEFLSEEGIYSPQDFIQKAAKVHLAYTDESLPMSFDDRINDLIDKIKKAAQSSGQTFLLKEIDPKTYNQVKAHINHYKEKYSELGVKTLADFITIIAGITDKKLNTKATMQELQERYVSKILEHSKDGMLQCRLPKLDPSLYSSIFAHIKNNKSAYDNLGVITVNDFIQKVAKVKLAQKRHRSLDQSSDATTQRLVNDILEFAKDTRSIHGLSRQNQKLYARIQQHLRYHKTEYQSMGITRPSDFITKIAGIKVDETRCGKRKTTCASDNSPNTISTKKQEIKLLSQAIDNQILVFCLSSGISPSEACEALGINLSKKRLQNLQTQFDSQTAQITTQQDENCDTISQEENTNNGKSI